jgi:hypothetical integral membrane protein (TIGR02206 family)
MTPENPFVHFGPAHLAALAVIGALAWLAAGGRRRRPFPPLSRKVRRGLAILLLGELLGLHLLYGFRGGWDPASDLPLHLCDVNQLLLALYLVRPRPGLFDVLFHWVLTSSALALLFPDLPYGFPSPQYFTLFSTHGLSLLILVHLVFGQGRLPGPRSPTRALMALLGYLPLPAAVNALTGGNYLYLAELPAVPIPFLGLLPPAPYYWPLGAALLYAVFRALYHLGPRRAR